MGKLRRKADLEPLQPLLLKFMGFLETDVILSYPETSRPRLQLDRVSVWIGIKSLLGLLEPSALEEGILEGYPIFLDIVLNQISGDSLVFSHAVTCLKILFEMLGCKLWLRSSLSPSAMRSTLVGQSFHTRSEKIHKDIFDLFEPFLKSLEALQDGELEKQRRNFLFFLLHQVPVSSNFSILMKQKACQIAFLIVLRGYKMNPPSPPFECSHMWGPSLVSSLKDTSLHPSLRQPAVNLIQTIVVSDTAALVMSTLHSDTYASIDEIITGLDISEDGEPALIPQFEEDEKSSWSEFSLQSALICEEYSGWMCIPMLWIDVLVEADITVLPQSFLKVVLWARSRLSFVEPGVGTEISVPIKTWLSSSATEVSDSFGWRTPTGSDDGGTNVSKNSVEAFTMHLPLVRTFNRLTAYFLVQMNQPQLKKQWSWEPKMGESIILLLADPNDSVRQIGKLILEEVSHTQGLTNGLKFLCSNEASRSASFLGLKHGIKLIELGPTVVKFQTLQHFLFLLCKLLKDGSLTVTVNDLKLPTNVSIAKYSSHGGFLHQPTFEPLTPNVGSSDMDAHLWERFRYNLSNAVWHYLQKVLLDGKTYIDCNSCQMTCVRVLELIPVVFEKLCPSIIVSRVYKKAKGMLDLRWLQDLIDWGKSSRSVVLVYWRKTILSLLTVLKGACSDISSSIIDTIEESVACDKAPLDEIKEELCHLFILLCEKVSNDLDRTDSSAKIMVPQEPSSGRKRFLPDVRLSHGVDSDVPRLDLITKSKEKDLSNVVVPSDKETKEHMTGQMQPIKPACGVDISITEPNNLICSVKKAAPVSEERHEQKHPARKKHSALSSSKDLCSAGLQNDAINLTLQKPKYDNIVKPLGMAVKMKSAGSETGGATSTSPISQNVSLKNLPSKNIIAERKKTREVSESVDELPKTLVHDAKDDPLESALSSAKSSPLVIPKAHAVVPKRQVIQLTSPVQNKSGHNRRAGSAIRRFKPLRLDDWYRPILEIDFFALVGQSSITGNKNLSTGKLKEVPLCFESPEQYVEIFRPLVLEEFKAQLHSSYLEMSSWDDVYCGILSVMSVNRVDDFHHVHFVHDESDIGSNKSFSENDLILLTKEPIHNSSHEVYMIGKVERRERDHKRKSSILIIRFYLQSSSSRLNKARRFLIERSKWHGSRIMSITPQLREFQALSSITEIPILPVILNPVGNSHVPIETKTSDLSNLAPPLRKILELSYNGSQLQAIGVSIGSLRSVKDFELSLVQGPPGTGKTRTIVAIVSGLLDLLQRKNSRFNDMRQDNTIFVKPIIRIREPTAIARAWQNAALAKQLDKHADKNNARSTELSIKGRVLICAQSNAAVDELVLRISNEGLCGSDGNVYKPYLVRVGNAKTVHPNSLPCFIDTLVDLRLVEERKLDDPGSKTSISSSTVLRAKLEKLADRIRYYEAMRANLGNGNTDGKHSMDDETQHMDEKDLSDAELGKKLKELYEQKKQMYKDLSGVQAQEKKVNDETRALRHRLRKAVLREAEIVVTTLSGSGGDLYEVCSENMSNHRFGSPSEHNLFDAVIIDEAAQALEPATLIPLQLLKSRGTKCIMVGDPKQLPATVISTVASKFLYECSMFERLQKAGHPVVMLTKQYRMHPEISRFPSVYFYDGKLLNGDQMNQKSALFHDTKGLGPYLFYDITDGLELRGNNSATMSLCNEREADAAVELLRFFKRRYPSEFFGGRIGIITPYKRQLSMLHSRFSAAFGSSVASDMEFNTVDGFQGREVDILLFSTVRAVSPCMPNAGVSSSSIGFVADVRRMNVALTRAKLSLWILGNARTLQTNKSWSALIEDAKARNLVVPVKMPYKFILETESQTSDAQTCGSKAIETKHSKKVISRSQNQNSDGEKHESSYRDYHPHNQQKEKVKKSQSSKMNMGSIRVTDSIMPVFPEKCDTLGKTREKLLTRKEYVHSSSGDDSIRYEKSAGNFCPAGNNSGDIYMHSEEHVSEAAELTNPGRRADKQTSENVIKASGSSRSKKKLISAISSSQSTIEETRVKDDAPCPSLAGKKNDLISKRKHQREAVDALLSSALISSKKREAYVKAVLPKRPLPKTSNASQESQPLKRVKVPPVKPKGTS
ncbi:hypothetical protein SAY87_028533 [Trapa incisa]|uniref:Helicase SEN1 n=1 Tax=Trapa incisa TaxID=236973 RepID=A0AAN7KVX4_9MYRT|nr:hypothetical protein SAY87_028533 [Trapa incisa]